MADSNDLQTELVEDGKEADNEPKISKVTSVEDEHEENPVGNVQPLKPSNAGEAPSEYADRSMSLTSREASMRIRQDNGEPPAITKKTLMGLVAVYFSVFLDMMGVSIVQPVLPFYAEKFGANSFQLGALYSSYSLTATFASYAMGKASDKYGRRPSILFSLFGTMVGFAVTGLATDYWSLLAYRFLTGAFGGSASIAQAYITDVVPSNQRPKYLAFTGATAALAFIVGPGLGSGLAEFGIRIPFFVSGGLGGFGLIFAYFVLLESHPRVKASQRDVTKGVDMEEVAIDSPEMSPTPEAIDENEKGHTVSGSNMTGDIPKEEYSDAIPKTVWLLGLMGIFDMMGWTSYTSMFAYYIILKFGLSTLAVGYVTLSLATFYVFTNLIIFSQFSKRYGIYVTSLGGLLVFTIGLALLPLPDNLWLSLACIAIGAAFGNGCVFPAMSAMAADYTNPTNRGKILAFNNTMQNVGMVIGPLVHGVIYEIDPDLVFYEAAGFTFCGFLVMLFLIRTNPNMRAPAKLKKEDTGGVEEEDWEWIPDKPTERDYRRLGKYLGKLLSHRNYNWVTHYEPLGQFLKDIFPEVRTDSLKSHIEDINFLRAHINEMRGEYDSIHSNAAVGYA